MFVNGKKHPHRPGLTLHQLLEELKIDQRTVAVMHEDEAYRPGKVPDVALGEQDVIEIVTMMQGG